MIRKIHSHTIDDGLLLPGDWVLDLGSRDFVFSRKMLSLGLNVIAVDPARGIVPILYCRMKKNFHFINKACVGKKISDSLTYFEYIDWGANSLYNKDSKHRLVQNKESDFIKSYDVDVITIAEIMDEFCVDQFGLIKIDIEGGEYDILLNFPSNCAKQITVEFHDWLGLNPYKNPEEFYKHVESTTLSDYEVKLRRRVMMSNIPTYSDVLYVLK